MPGDFTVWTPSWTGLAHFASISCVQFFSSGSWYLFCDTRSQMKRWRFSVYYTFVYSFSRSFQLSFLFFLYIQENFHSKMYMLFTGWVARIGRNCARGCTQTEGTISPNTDRPRPVNSIFIFFLLRLKSFRKILLQPPTYVC